MGELSLMGSRAARSASVITPCAMLALSGCGGASEQRVAVDGYQFRVPAQHLVQGSIFFLPQQQNDGLRFVLNPGDELPAQHMVSLGPLSESCRLTRGGNIPGGTVASTQVVDSCAAAKAATPWPVLGTTAALQRVYGSGSTTQWSYLQAQPGAAGHPAVVATCTAMPGQNGLCISDGAYKHLKYSLHFRERELASLGAMHAQVRTLLRAWEH